MELRISRTIAIDESEADLQAIRAQGSGGQRLAQIPSGQHCERNTP